MSRILEKYWETESRISYTTSEQNSSFRACTVLAVFFEAWDILPLRRMSKSIELSRSGRTIFRKAKHEKPRRFYLRSYLLYLFLQSIPSLSLSLSPFSLALKHELLHLTHVPCFNTRTRIFSRCTRLHIDANAVSHSTREGEPRFSTTRSQSFAS